MHGQECRHSKRKVGGHFGRSFCLGTLGKTHGANYVKCTTFSTCMTPNCHMFTKLTTIGLLLSPRGVELLD
jgi:hypothetical protein